MDEDDIRLYRYYGAYTTKGLRPTYGAQPSFRAIITKYNYTYYSYFTNDRRGFLILSLSTQLIISSLIITAL